MDKKLMELIDSIVDAQKEDREYSKKEIAAIQAEIKKLGQNKNLTSRLDDLEIQFQHIGQGVSSNSAISEDERRYKAAFFSYILRGQDALSSEIRNELSVGSDPKGGYWVPATTSKRIIQKVFETSAIRQICYSETIPSDRLELAIDNGEAGGGGWVGEVQTRSETEAPEIATLEIPLMEQYAMPVATQRWLDTVSTPQGVDRAETWLVNKIASKLARGENSAFINGDGVGKPRGFLTYTATLQDDDSRDWGKLQYIKSGASGAFKSAGNGPADPLYELVFSLKEEFLTNAVWAMNRLTLLAISTIKDADGRPLLGTAKLQDKTPFELLGFPVYLFADMPQIAADAIGIAFGDFGRGYTIVDHTRGLRVLRDPFTTKGKVKFYASKLTGGALSNSEAIKLLKFSA